MCREMFGSLLSRSQAFKYGNIQCRSKDVVIAAHYPQFLPNRLAHPCPFGNNVALSGQKYHQRKDLHLQFTNL